VFAVTLMFDGAVPLVDESESQSTFFDALHARMPCDVVTVRVFAAGLVPPVTPVNEREVGERPIVGGCAIVNDTVMLSGLLPAPAEVIVSVPM
jgi:hypothetical protein